jgi:hypothetical protein
VSLHNQAEVVFGENDEVGRTAAERSVRDRT